MTTVLASSRDKVIVADSRMSSGPDAAPVKKLFSIQVPSFGECIAGFSGDYTACLAFISWMSRGMDAKEGKILKKSQGAEVIILSSQNIIAYFDLVEMLFIPYPGDATAIGTGAQAALACHIGGIKATRAVEIACTVDSSSALPTLTGRFRGSKALIR